MTDTVAHGAPDRPILVRSPRQAPYAGATRFGTHIGHAHRPRVDEQRSPRVEADGGEPDAMHRLRRSGQTRSASIDPRKRRWPSAPSTRGEACPACAAHEMPARVVRGAVGLSEDGLLVVVEVDGPVVGVDEDVVAAAQQHAVVHAGFAVVLPVGAVVDIAPVGGPVTVGEAAGAIALDDGVPDPFGPLPGRPADIEHLAVGAQHDADPGVVAPRIGWERPVRLDLRPVHGRADDEVDAVAAAARPLTGCVPEGLRGERPSAWGSRRRAACILRASSASRRVGDELIVPPNEQPLKRRKPVHVTSRRPTQRKSASWCLHYKTGV